MASWEIEYANSYISSTDQKLTHNKKRSEKLKKKSKPNQLEWIHRHTANSTLSVRHMKSDANHLRCVSWFYHFFIILFLQPNVVGLQWM